MSKPQYQTIEQMLLLVDEPNRSACQKILNENRPLFQMVQGSTNNHQAWPGGYHDHVQEIMNIAVVLYEQLNSIRPLPFSLSDALLVVYLHDIEKPWKYEMGPDGQLEVIEALQEKGAQHEFRTRKLIEYGVSLTSEQLNALKYVEGEYKDYSSRKRVMGPLAALCHMADVASARIDFDHPLEKDDPWTDAKRNRD